MLGYGGFCQFGEGLGEGVGVGGVPVTCGGCWWAGGETDMWMIGPRVELGGALLAPAGGEDGVFEWVAEEIAEGTDATAIGA
jgi:hypothetical protein